MERTSFYTTLIEQQDFRLLVLLIVIPIFLVNQL